MKKFDKIINNLLSESISKRADELAEKIKNKVNMDEDIDPFELEVDSEYDYKKSEDEPSERVIFKGRIPHGGKFERKNSNNKMIFTNKMIKNKINKPSNDEFEVEMEEGNKFSGALADAKKQGKSTFKVDGKTYKVETNEDLGGMDDSHPAFGGMNLMNPSDEDKETIEKYLRRYIKRDHDEEDEFKGFETLEESEKFIQKATKEMEKKGTEGSFKEYCGGKVTKSCIDKAMKSGDSKLIKKANFAKNIGGFKGAKHESVTYRVAISENYNVDLTEDELVDMIETVIEEQQITSNVKGGKAKGLVQYDRVHDKDADINKKALKDVEKKMKDYVKAGSKGNYETNPKHFPKGNGELGEMSKKAYRASDAVEEYIENFAYSPGMENLKYDEIEPNDEWLSANIEGSEKTGNSPKYANAVETDLGKKINKKRKENLYQKEVDRSYKRVKQPVDTAGEDKKDGKLDKMFAKLGESETEKTNLINEEMNMMKKLISYNQKTQ